MITWIRNLLALSGASMEDKLKVVHEIIAYIFYFHRPRAVLQDDPDEEDLADASGCAAGVFVGDGFDTEFY